MMPDKTEDKAEDKSGEKAKETKFSDLLQDELILKNLEVGMGFKSPTPIQVEAMGTVIEGKDIFAGARTGSGKTVAFLAPLLQRMRKGELKRILVLAPTRELVQQIDEQAMNLLEGDKDISPIALFGGVPTDQHILAMKHHDPKVYLANPGRFIDLLHEGVIPTDEIEAIVLDEADRMCDMGFSPQVEEILSELPKRKQNLFFSATLPKELNGMMDKYSNKPVRIQVDSAIEASDTISHRAIFCSRRQKVDEARKLFKDSPELVSVVFTKTRKGSDQLYSSLNRDFKDVGIIHAGYSQPERERTIAKFRDEKIKILICTDVMARGIDVSHINRVIHYDLPESLEDYIHRSGRSGRAGRKGESVAVVERDNRGQVGRFHEYAKTIDFDMPEKKDREGSADDSSNDRNRNRSRRPSGSNKGSGPRNNKGRNKSRNRSQNKRPRRQEDSKSSQTSNKSSSGKPAEKSKDSSKKTSSNKKTGSVLKRAFKKIFSYVDI